MSKVLLSASRRSLSMDHVHIEKLKVQAIVGPDAWNQLQSQNLNVTLSMATDFKKSSETDDLKYSLNYAVISRDVTSKIQKDLTKNFKDIHSLSQMILRYTKGRYPGIASLEVKVESNEADIRCGHLASVINDTEPEKNCLVISDFKILTLIGVFTFERLQKQYIDLMIKLPVGDNCPPYREIIRMVTNYVERSNFKTVEALVETVSQLILTENEIFRKSPNLPISVKVIKLNAITQTEGVGVSVIRSFEDFKHIQNISDTELKTFKRASFDLPVVSHEIIKDAWNTAVLAFGSNVGNRFENILSAITHLEGHEKVDVVSTSSIFESEPMYFKDQQPFLNGCLKIKTQLSPTELLDLCKKIEYEELHRVKHFDNGPRSIDLDIIMFYDSNGKPYTLNLDELIIPHPRMLERSFVLEPLCELISPEVIHPITAEPIHNHLWQLYSNDNPEDLLWKLVPVGKSFLKFKTEWERDVFTGSRRRVTRSPAYLMGIVNVTPDSFSDGTKDYDNVVITLSKVEKMIKEALELHDIVILDIGGCSTRPGSLQATEEVELSRVLPIINAIISSKTIPLEQVILSVDTYNSGVAEAVINAGAGIINDISGGAFDPKILEVVSKHPNVAYVLSHIRGNIQSMSSETDYLHRDDSVKEFLFNKEDDNDHNLFIKTIGREMSARYSQILKTGVLRWQIILDPGIGFAKVGKQNLDLIKGIPVLKNYSCIMEDEFVSLSNLPVLLGPSRKKFIGDITKTPVAIDRDFTTGALLSSCISNECDIIRVHDVKNCSKSLKIINELCRS